MENDQTTYNYSYEQYLDLWEGLFGEETEVDREGKLHGLPFSYTITKQSREGFDKHLSAVNALYAQIEQELKKGQDGADWNLLDSLWVQAFRHEAELLV